MSEANALESSAWDGRFKKPAGRKLSAKQHWRELSAQGVAISESSIQNFLRLGMPEDEPDRTNWLVANMREDPRIPQGGAEPKLSADDYSSLELELLRQKVRKVKASADREENNRDKERGRVVETEAIMDIIIGYAKDARDQINKIPNTLKGHFSDAAMQVTVAQAASEVCAQTIKTIVHGINEACLKLGLNTVMEQDGIRNRRRGRKRLDAEAASATGTQVS